MVQYFDLLSFYLKNMNTKQSLENKKQKQSILGQITSRILS